MARRLGEKLQKRPNSPSGGSVVSGSAPARREVHVRGEVGIRAPVESVRCAAVITIVLADDHPVVRSGLRALLDAEDDFEVVAEAGDVPDTVRFLRGHRPTIAVVDLNMPGG